MESKNEIIDKLKANVISKLDELDSSKKHDSTLIDYILVMVINQKNKFEMKHNLSLFLGKIVDDFVNWLFDFLAQLDANKLNVTETNSGNNNNDQQEIKCKDEAEKIVESKNNEPILKTETQSETPLKKVLPPKRKLKSAILTVKNESNEDEMMPCDDHQVPLKEPSKSKKRILADEDSYPSRKRSVLDSNSKSDSKRNLIEIKPTDEKSSNQPNNKIETDDATKENETKFLVTLDGVKDMFQDGIKDDLFLLDEDFDPELMHEDLSNVVPTQVVQNDISIKENNNSTNKLPERCKYWPSCLNGPKCDFFHPVTKCNTFPFCRFGDKCLYIHPTCKFDSFCSRKDCPFVHTAKRGQLNNPPPPMTCKYFPNCMKPSCEFFHPKVCHFGAACKSFNCPYAHLPSPKPAAPHSSKFKWSSDKGTSLSLSDNKKEIEIK